MAGLAETIAATVTHPWIGVDLDGTLARDDGWRGPQHVGEPIPAMLDRVLTWIREGRDVRILTARVASTNPGRPASLIAIRAWCRQHLGRELPITAEKDQNLVEFWDDRCIQVVPNTGQPVKQAAKVLA